MDGRGSAFAVRRRQRYRDTQGATSGPAKGLPCLLKRLDRAPDRRRDRVGDGPPRLRPVALR